MPTPDGRLSVGILGCGRIAGAFAVAGERPTTHAQALSANGGFHLAVASDVSAERARAFATRWGGTQAANPDDLAAAGLDLVAVCSPDITHASLLQKLLAGPRPPRLIVMEKPLCLLPSDLRAIDQALAKQPRTTLVVNHSRRFDSGHLAARDLIASQKLGPVVGAHWVYYGGLMHIGVHLVDTLRLLFGAELEPESVRLACDDRADDPGLDVVFRCGAWPKARIHVESHPESAFQLFDGEIRLRDGRIRFTDFGSVVELETATTNTAGERELHDKRLLLNGKHPTPMQTLYDLAGRYLLHGDREIVSRAGFDQALATMGTLFAAKSKLAT